MNQRKQKKNYVNRFSKNKFWDKILSLLVAFAVYYLIIYIPIYSLSFLEKKQKQKNYNKLKLF
jgi:hypothetical protein